VRAHYFQHVPFEGLGSIEPWLIGRGYEITRTLLSEPEPLPSPGEVDFLIIMGGPMSVNDLDEYPRLASEKDFIGKFIATGKPVLGICLGAQLIASALGGRVFPNHRREIGWYPVRGVSPADPGLFPFPGEAEVFHWHGETFSLPEGAVRIARSAACENQAFQIGANVIGLQFHLETTAESARILVENSRDELTGGEYVQGEGEILAAPPSRYEGINRLMGELLDYLTSPPPLEYSLSGEDFLTYQLFEANNSKRIRSRRRRNWLLIPLIYSLLSIPLAYLTDRVMTFGFIGLALIWLIFYPFYSRWLYRRHYVKHIADYYANRLDKAVVTALEGHRFFLRDDVSESRINADQAEAIWRLPSHVLIKFLSGNTLIIPTERVESSRLDRFLKGVSAVTGLAVTDRSDWKWK